MRLFFENAQNYVQVEFSIEAKGSSQLLCQQNEENCVSRNNHRMQASSANEEETQNVFSCIFVFKVLVATCYWY